MIFQADFARSSGQVPHIVIFSQISERDGATLLRCIAAALQERHIVVQYLIVTTYEQRLDRINDTGKLSVFSVL